MRRFRYHSDYPQERIKVAQMDLTLVRRLLLYVYPYRYLVSIAVLCLVLAKVLETVIPIGLGILSQNILDTLHSPLKEPSLLSTTFQGCLLLIGCLVASYLLESGSVIFKNWIAQHALYKMRLNVFEHIQFLPIRYFDTHAIGRLMTRTIHDIEQIHLMFTDSVVPLLGSLFLFVSIFIAIFWMDWRLGLVVFAIVPVLLWIAENFRVNQRRCYDQIRNLVSAMNTFVQEHLMGVVTVRLFGIQKQEKKKFEKMNEDYKTAYMESLHHFSYLFASIDFLQSLGLIAIFFVLTFFTKPEEGFQAGLFFTYSLYIMMLFRPIADLAERYNLLQSAIAAAQKVFHILDEEAEIETGEKSLTSIESIVFEEVWFAYEEENWVLRGVSFTVKRGDRVALVGMTGAGKTTILSLLLRFYEIQKGRILVNGIDIRSYSKQALRPAFAVVLQDPVIFSDSIAENISLKQPGISWEHICEAAEFVHLGPLIRRFPDGLHHKLKEQGRDLSAGEKQLISLARAFSHDRSMLILDEATANIDVVTERLIQDAMERMMKHKTSLVIAHRLSTIRNATKILVIHQGKVLEEGNHEELIRVKGIYEKLYRIQFNA